MFSATRKPATNASMPEIYDLYIFLKKDIPDLSPPLVTKCELVF